MSLMIICTLRAFFLDFFFFSLYQGRRICDGRCLFFCFTFRKIKFDLCRSCNNNKLIMTNNINKRVHLSFYYGGVFNCGSPNTMQGRPLLAKGRTAAQIKHGPQEQKNTSFFLFCFSLNNLFYLVPAKRSLRVSLLLNGSEILFYAKDWLWTPQKEKELINTANQGKNAFISVGNKRDEIQFLKHSLDYVGSDKSKICSDVRPSAEHIRAVRWVHSLFFGQWF